MATVSRGNRRYEVVYAKVQALDDAPLPVRVGLSIPAYDTVIHTYVGENQQPSQSVYRQGGAEGVIVATVTRTFDGTGRLLSETLS
jgi:hypothetical protein